MRFTIQDWQATFLGMRELPRDINDFEVKTSSTFDDTECEAINTRWGDARKLGLALYIGFLRIDGHLLYAFRMIPVVLWRHLSEKLGIATPDVVSLCTLYEWEKTLFGHQQVACVTLGFRWMLWSKSIGTARCIWRFRS